MTFGQLFTIMNPNIGVRKNGTCIWLYLDDVNYYTIGTEWWDKEIPDNAIVALLKEQEPIEPKVDVDKWRCGNCGHELEHQELLGENVLFHEQYSYCPQCGKAVKWDD